ncbi:MAG: hypothetical protein ACAI43_18710, partial [Phycisphaerae bacterium]
NAGGSPMTVPTRLIFALLIALVATFAYTHPVGGDDRPAPAANDSRFTYVDLTIDPAGKPLAAWQIEFAAEVGTVSLVGIEAGEHPAYAKRPAYYDPAALAGRRVIVGDYSLDKTLPAARTRVARLMLEIRGGVAPQYVAKLTAAADPDGKQIPGATVTVVPAP